MKAILQYGQFTCMIQISTVLPTISIFKPLEQVSLLPMEELFTPSEIKLSRLEFKYSERLSADVLIYKFERES